MNNKATFSEYLNTVVSHNEIKTDLTNKMSRDLGSMMLKKGCCIPHKRLEDYGLYRFRGENDVKRLLQKHFDVDFDYKMYQIEQSNGKGTRPISNIYFLTPECFKMLCMLSQNKKEGRRIRQYFVDIEKAINMYAKYELEYDTASNARAVREHDQRMHAIMSNLEAVISQNKRLMDDNRLVQEKLNVTTEDRVAMYMCSRR